MAYKVDFKRVLVNLGVGFFIVLFSLLILSFTRRGLYSKDLGLNLVVVGDDGIGIALVRPKEGYLVWIKLPLAMQIKVDSSNAIFAVSSFWKYAEKERNSLDLVAKSVSGTLGVILPSAIKVEGKAVPENLLRSLHSFSLNTNLTLRDRIMIRKDLVDLVSTRKTLEVDIPKSALTIKKDPDGVEFFEVNSVVNLWTKNRFVFESLLGEDASLSVYNLSGVAGQGVLTARKLESAGARVVLVDSKYDGEVPEGSGCVFRSSSEYVFTDYLLERFMRCKKIFYKDTVKKEGIEVWLL